MTLCHVTSLQLSFGLPAGDVFSSLLNISNTLQQPHSPTVMCNS